MDRFLFALSLTLSFTFTYAFDSLAGPLSSYYARVPESKALTTTGWARQREFLPTSIKALVWNIKKTEMKTWHKEFVKYSKGQDLILVQEAFNNPLFASTLVGLDGYRFDFGVSFIFKKKDNAATGTMIGARVEPTEAKVRHSEDNEPIVGTPKSITFAKYPIEGKSEELLVVSVHAINMTTLGAFERHMSQAHAEMRKHKGPIFCAGDFNTWSKNRKEYLFHIARKLKLKTVKFKNGDARMKFAGHYLDHGFTRGLKVKYAEVIADSKGSDHKPLMLEFSLYD